MNKCIRMGMTVLKIVIWRGILLVLWPQIVFYGSTGASRLNEISDHKTDILPPPNNNFEHSFPKVTVSFTTKTFNKIVKNTVPT